jgi:hypothetical protein
VAGIVESFKQGYQGRDCGRFKVGATPVRCSQCGGNHFDTADALINTRGLTFVGLDFADRGANLLICTACTHVEWFLDQPEAV